MEATVSYGPKPIVVNALLPFVTNRHAQVASKAATYVDMCFENMGVGRVSEKAGEQGLEEGLQGLPEGLEVDELLEVLETGMGLKNSEGRKASTSAMTRQVLFFVFWTDDVG